MKELSDKPNDVQFKPNDVQFKYHFVDCFCTVFNFSFSERVCATKRQLFDLFEEAVKFNHLFQKLNECQVLLERLLRQKMNSYFEFKKENPRESKIDRIDERPCNHQKNEHQTDFLSSIDNIIEGLVSSKVILTLRHRKFQFSYTLTATVTRLNINS